MLRKLLVGVLTLQICLAVGVLDNDNHHGDDRRQWWGVASSSDGNRLVAVVGGLEGAEGRIYVSSDKGQTWSANDIVRSWRAVASSADGANLVAVEDSSRKGGYIYTSSDSGKSWVMRLSAGCQHWISVASSADGVLLAAVVGGYGISVCVCMHINNSDTIFNLRMKFIALFLQAKAVASLRHPMLAKRGWNAWQMPRTAGSTLRCHQTAPRSLHVPVSAISTQGICYCSKPPCLRTWRDSMHSLCCNHSCLSFVPLSLSRAFLPPYTPPRLHLLI